MLKAGPQQNWPQRSAAAQAERDNANNFRYSQTQVIPATEEGFTGDPSGWFDGKLVQKTGCCVMCWMSLTVA